MNSYNKTQKIITPIDRASGSKLSTAASEIAQTVGPVAKKAASEVTSLLSSQYRPPSPFHFRVDFLGFPNPSGFGFKEVDGISATMEVRDQPEGGINTYNRRTLGKIRYENLSLKRGAANLTSPLVNWVRMTLEMGVNGKIIPQPLTVSLLNEDALPIMVWSFVDAVPVKWSMGPLDSMDDGTVLIETLELSYLYFTRTV